ncbi:hypothetical protein TARUN_6351 [Trichoderma arundinaceum]|uniref:Uncharacterized protein n=1 Tax=Trichoderma arundinaceum TaxID=490622 RepID=A0A395NIN9_TRIAR|nr:hypothetical protein TARUN_6351 [Trichoderma arundinaceum]
MKKGEKRAAKKKEYKKKQMQKKAKKEALDRSSEAKAVTASEEEEKEEGVKQKTGRRHKLPAESSSSSAAPRLPARGVAGLRPGVSLSVGRGLGRPGEAAATPFASCWEEDGSSTGSAYKQVPGCSLGSVQLSMRRRGSSSAQLSSAQLNSAQHGATQFSSVN